MCAHLIFLPANLLQYTHNIPPYNIKMDAFLPETLRDPAALLCLIFEEDDEE